MTAPNGGTIGGEDGGRGESLVFCGCDIREARRGDGGREVHIIAAGFADGKGWGERREWC